MTGVEWTLRKYTTILNSFRYLRYWGAGVMLSNLLLLLLLSVGATESSNVSLPGQAGIVITAAATNTQIGDYVWLDVNRNGIQDSGEIGMAGITVTLHLSGTGAVADTTTDAAGIYTFTNVISGTYAVAFHRPTGYLFSPQNEGNNATLDSDVDPITGLTPLFQAPDGVVDDTWDAGLMPGNVSDKIYFPVVALRMLIPPVLVNGAFEQWTDGWTLRNNGLPTSIESQSSDPSVPLGAFSALLGRVNYPCNATGVPLGNAAIEQSYAVPQSSQHVTLRFKYIVWSQDVSTSSQYDRFEVFVAPQGGTARLVFSDGNMVNQGLGCDVWRRVPGPQNPRDGQTTGWAEAVVNLDSYKGQMVTFSFRNYSRYDGWYNTYTYLDDVRVVFGN